MNFSGSLTDDNHMAGQEFNQGGNQLNGSWSQTLHERRPSSNEIACQPGHYPDPEPRYNKYMVVSSAISQDYPSARPRPENIMYRDGPKPKPAVTSHDEQTYSTQSLSSHFLPLPLLESSTGSQIAPNFNSLVVRGNCCQPPPPLPPPPLPTTKSLKKKTRAKAKKVKALLQQVHESNGGVQNDQSLESHSQPDKRMGRFVPDETNCQKGVAAATVSHPKRVATAAGRKKALKRTLSQAVSDNQEVNSHGTVPCKKGKKSKKNSHEEVHTNTHQATVDTNTPDQNQIVIKEEFWKLRDQSKCPVCAAATESYEAYVDHLGQTMHEEAVTSLRSKEGKSLHKCRLGILKRYMKSSKNARVKKPEPGPNFCTICNKSYGLQSFAHNKTKHHRILAAGLQRQCKVCSLDFDTRVSLLIHTATAQHLQNLFVQELEEGLLTVDQIHNREQRQEKNQLICHVPDKVDIKEDLWKNPKCPICPAKAESFQAYVDHLSQTMHRDALKLVGEKERRKMRISRRKILKRHRESLTEEQAGEFSATTPMPGGPNRCAICDMFIKEEWSVHGQSEFHKVLAKGMRRKCTVCCQHFDNRLSLLLHQASIQHLQKAFENELLKNGDAKDDDNPANAKEPNVRVDEMSVAAAAAEIPNAAENNNEEAAPNASTTEEKNELHRDGCDAEDVFWNNIKEEAQKDINGECDGEPHIKDETVMVEERMGESAVSAAEFLLPPPSSIDAKTTEGENFGESFIKSVVMLYCDGCRMVLPATFSKKAEARGLTDKDIIAQHCKSPAHIKNCTKRMQRQ